MEGGAGEEAGEAATDVDRRLICGAEIPEMQTRTLVDEQVGVSGRTAVVELKRSGRKRSAAPDCEARDGRRTVEDAGAEDIERGTRGIGGAEILNV